MEELEAQDYEQITSKERGDALEKAVQHIFSVAGFSTTRNKRIATYEIDVLAEIGDRKIIIECKNYQNGRLTLRNLIHQWRSKNEIINAHKIIIALAGLKISSEDLELASSYDIELWNQEDISELFNLSLEPNRLRELLISKIDFRPLTISEVYRERVTYVVITSKISSLWVTEETLFHKMNTWLRAYILTELELRETSKEERRLHIELFEGTKTKKGFLNIGTKKRTEKDYWETVGTRLENDLILSKDTQDRYLSHMSELQNEFDLQFEFFQGDEHLEILRKLLGSRLHNAFHYNQSCSFYRENHHESVNIALNEKGHIELIVNYLESGQRNILNWILTSQSEEIFDDNRNLNGFKWHCSSVQDAEEKVFRIFTEYFQIKPTDKIMDRELDNLIS